MPRRPDLSEFDHPLSPAELEGLQRHLAGLDSLRVQRFYQAAYEKCRLHGELIPRAADVQELVTAWKALRHMKRRRPQRRD